jgi:hypothetical protein
MKGQKFYGKGTVAHVESPWIAGHIEEAFIENDECDCVITNICKKLSIGTKVSITIEVLE